MRSRHQQAISIHGRIRRRSSALVLSALNSVAPGREEKAIMVRLTIWLYIFWLLKLL